MNNGDLSLHSRIKFNILAPLQICNELMMGLRSGLFLMLNFLMLTVQTVSAQLNIPTLKLRFEELGVDNGLSQGLVNAAIQDKEGYLWFGTKDGLDRYDGYNFKIFRHNDRDSNSIAYNHIVSVFEDSKRRMWLGMVQEGLDLYDRERDRFIHFKKVKTKNGYLIFKGVSQIAEDDEGHIWITSEESIEPIVLDIVSKPARDGFEIRAEKGADYIFEKYHFVLPLHSYFIMNRMAQREILFMTRDSIFSFNKNRIDKMSALNSLMHNAFYTKIRNRDSFMTIFNLFKSCPATVHHLIYMTEIASKAFFCYDEKSKTLKILSHGSYNPGNRFSWGR